MLKDMKLEVITLDDGFTVNRRKLGKMPFVMDLNGFPHQLINRYLLEYEALKMKRNVEQTITEKARRIVFIYNELNSLIIDGSDEIHRSISMLSDDQPILTDRFHELWRLTTEAKLIMLQENHEQEQTAAPSTINKNFSTYCHFLFWAEENGYCDGVIGFNNKNKTGYQVPVSPAREKSKAKFSLSWKLENQGKAPLPRGMITKHDKAYEALINKGDDEKSVFLAERIFCYFDA